MVPTMKAFLYFFVAGAVVFNVSAADEPSAKLKNDKEKVSYSLGMNVGRALKQQQMEVDLEIMVQAIKDVLQGKETLLTDEQASEAVNNYRREMIRQQQEANKAAGDAFLAENKTKPGVVTTASGLQYQVMNMGDGPKPTAQDTVQVHYRGTLLDGTEFDNSYKRGGPAKFGVTGVIKGWTEVLQLMPTGSKWKVFIPSDLAYGPSGRRGIPPNAMLTFDIELVSIEPKEAQAQPVQPKPLAPKIEVK